MSIEPNTGKNPLSENIQRTVERTALRKVRKLIDVLDADETKKQRLEKRALWIAAIVGGIVVAWFVWSLLASDKKFERSQDKT